MAEMLDQLGLGGRARSARRSAFGRGKAARGCGTGTVKEAAVLLRRRAYRLARLGAWRAGHSSVALGRPRQRGRVVPGRPRSPALAVCRPRVAPGRRTLFRRASAFACGVTLMTLFAPARRLLWSVIGIAAGTALVTGALWFSRLAARSAGPSHSKSAAGRGSRGKRGLLRDGGDSSTESPRSIRCSQAG